MTHSDTTPKRTPFSQYHEAAGAKMVPFAGFYMPVQYKGITSEHLAVRQNVGLFQRYFQLKARLLGLEKLRRYDIYAPLAPAVKRYEYSYARQIILDSFRAFTPQIADLAKRVFDENHLDSVTRLGKQRGAFCLSVLPRLTP